MKRKKRSTFPAGSWVHAWVVLRSPEAEPSRAEPRGRGLTMT